MIQLTGEMGTIISTPMADPLFSMGTPVTIRCQALGGVPFMGGLTPILCIPMEMIASMGGLEETS